MPFAAIGLAALDRRAMRAVRSDDADAAGDVEPAVTVAPSIVGLAAGDRHRVIRIG